MPREVKSVEEFLKLAERAEECRVKRLKDGVVKLKLRTPRYLYTLKVESGEVEAVLRQLRCPIREI